MRGLGHADDLEHLADSLPQRRPVEAVQLADEIQQLAASHPAVEARILVQVANVARQLAARPADPHAGHRARACGRGGEAGEEAQGRRLARAVGSEEAEDAAARDGQGQVIEGDYAAVALGQAGGGDSRVGALRKSGPRRQDAGNGCGWGGADASRLDAARVVPAHEEVDQRPNDVDEGDDEGPDDLVAPNPAILLEEVVQREQHQSELQEE